MKEMKEMKEKKKIIKLSSKSCIPCSTYALIFDSWAEKEGKGIIEIERVDVEENPEIASKYRIMSVPTTILLINWEPIEVKTGVLSKEILNEMCE